MKRSTLYMVAAGMVLGILTGMFVSRRGKATETRAPESSDLSVPAHGDWVAGPGLVEPLSESVKVGAELTGKLQSVLVDEGDRVKKGQVLAVLVNDDYRAAVLAARANLADKQASLEKVIHGARQQERSEALAAANEAEANMKNAQAEMQRRERLYRKGVVSREETENFENQYSVAKARYDAALEHYRLIDADARSEDVSMGQAQIQLAQAQLAEDEARYEKTFIRSPLNGVILRRHHRAGENVVSSNSNPDPVFTLGDCKVLRVRMDVDEADVAGLRLDERAYVTARAYGDRKFWGKVVQLGEQLGKKNVQTDEPTEHVDKKILETLVQLDDAKELPVGLRVDGYIETAQ
ncbi:MAG: HlyD family secretion protein [Terriglobia bacterium]